MQCPKCDSENVVKKAIRPFPDGRVELECRKCKQEFMDNEKTDEEALALIRYGKQRDEKVIGLNILYKRYAPWLQKLIQSPRILCRNIKKSVMPGHFSQEVAEDICDAVFEEFFRKIEFMMNILKIGNQIKQIQSKPSFGLLLLIKL